MFNYEQGESKPRSVIRIIFRIAIVITISLLVKQWVSPMFRSTYRSYSTQSNYVESAKPWTRQTLPELAMSIELRGQLKPTEHLLPPDTKSKTRLSRSYEYEGNYHHVSIFHALYVDSVVPSAEGGAKGAIENIRKLEDVVNLDYTITQESPARASFRGTYTQGGGNFTVRGFVATRGQKIWLVIGINARDQYEAAKETDHILKSVSFQ